jgi:beta-N-acetylhexosaminidase
MIRLIRQEIGFRGILMTDDLNMQALKGSLADRTARARRAGCDIALHCKGVLAEMEEVAAAAGTLSVEAQARWDQSLALRRSPALDIAALDAELKGIMDGHLG